MTKWLIKDSTETNKLLTTSKVFGNNEVFILDHYSGKFPIIEYQNKIVPHPTYYPSLQLDSNMATALQGYVNGNKTQSIKDFLDFVTRNKWGMVLSFYYIEDYSKILEQGLSLDEAIKKFKSFAIPKTEAILKIYLMDENHFLKTGEIRETDIQTQKNYYLREHSSISELAQSRVNNFIKFYDTEYFKQILIIKILIIKMVLIHNFELDNKKPNEKLNAFDDFMQEHLGVILSREIMLADLYFRGKTGKFLGINKNSSLKNILQNISSTAWDIFLLRLPELSFVHYNGLHPDGTMDLPYIATKEVKLFEFGKLFEYDHIHTNSDSTKLVYFTNNNFTYSIDKKIYSNKKDYPENLLNDLLSELKRLYPK
ncbi:hypothetical protein [Mannheimia indoligenes]|uniref:hypothetical protein n=1 Tax=Mannheimia indoligenes TaxID=3103145 RepID=UPI002FE5E840